MTRGLPWQIRFAPFLVSATAALWVSTSAAAQSGAPPIRVESGEVAVPTFVYDNRLHPVPGLGSSDFHVIEDGKEQRIDRITVERLYVKYFRDNLGVEEREWAQTRGQKWSILDRGAFPRTVFGGDFYVVAYVPRASSAGACHSVKVSAKRKDVGVYFRNEYCDTPHPVDDPLYGTKLSTQMEHNGASGNLGKLKLDAQAGFLYREPDRSTVYLTLEFSPDSIKLPLNSDLAFRVAVLTSAFRKDGILAARSSDLDEAYFWKGAFEPISRNTAFQRITRATYVPDHHETQMELPPGDYEIQAVMSDGAKFGATRLSLSIPELDRRRTGISSLFVCNQFHDPTQSLHDDPPWARFSTRENPRSTLAEFAPLASKGKEFTPTADTAFSQKRNLLLYYEVYPPTLNGTSTMPLETRMRIINTATGAVETDTGWLSATDEIESGKWAIPVVEQIVTPGLAKGSYRVEVQASDSGGQASPLRITTFTVK